MDSERKWTRGPARVAVWVIVGALPMAGLASLLLRSQLDPHIENYPLHFVVFGIVGAVAFALGYAAGEAANRRGDARILLLSLAFMATGGFLLLHAIGTPTVLFAEEHAGFQVAIPVGLVLSAVFAMGSGFVDARPELADAVIRHRGLLRGGVLAAMAGWFGWTVANLPPFGGPNSEAATSRLLTVFAVLGTAVYAVAALRYWRLFRNRRSWLAAAVVACFVLLAQAMIGVAVTGERKWHASWWEWHGLILLAYAVVGLAVRREWADERFRRLYLPTTRERYEDVSVLFADLVGFTGFAERSSPARAAGVLDAYWGIAAPLITQRFGGEVEKFIGDGIMARFNVMGDQPDHAIRAASAALALQREVAALVARHPDWPRMRVGVNSGTVLVREIGSDGYVAYPSVGDAVNTGARLESLAPAGGVLIGHETYLKLPPGTVVEKRTGLRLRGKDDTVDAYVLHALPWAPGDNHRVEGEEMFGDLMSFETLRRQQERELEVQLSRKRFEPRDTAPSGWRAALAARLWDSARKRSSLDRKRTALGRIPLFAGLPQESFELLARNAEVVAVPAGIDVIREGEAGHEFFAIAAGDVEISKKGRRVATERAGGVFGEIALLRGIPRTATVTTTAPSQLFVLHAQAFHSLVAPSFS